MEQSRVPVFLLLAFLLLCCGIGEVEGKSSYWERAGTLLKLLNGCPEEITVVLLTKACEDFQSSLCQNVVDTAWKVYELFGGGAAIGVDYICQKIGELIYPYVKGIAQFVGRIVSDAYEYLRRLFHKYMTSPRRRLLT